MSITCDRCGRDVSEVSLVDSPYPNDERLYCLDCYLHLFPPGWTDTYQPLKDIDSPNERKLLQGTSMIRSPNKPTLVDSDGFRHGCTVTLTAQHDSGDEG